MFIDVTVTGVIVRQNGGGELRLKDRQPAVGRSGSMVGQQVLFFDRAPPNVYTLEGKDLQIGVSSFEDITLDGRKIAERSGYAGIKFVVDQIEEG